MGKIDLFKTGVGKRFGGSVASLGYESSKGCIF